MRKLGGSMAQKIILGALDDDMYRSFCGKCPRYKRDEADGQEVCPVQFKMDNPECTHNAEFLSVKEHADAIQKIIDGE